jgi:hypothetical protein
MNGIAPVVRPEMYKSVATERLVVDALNALKSVAVTDDKFALVL